MVQHLLLGDLGAAALVLGLTGPLRPRPRCGPCGPPLPRAPARRAPALGVCSSAGTDAALRRRPRHEAFTPSSTSPSSPRHAPLGRDPRAAAGPGMVHGGLEAPVCRRRCGSSLSRSRRSSSGRATRTTVQLLARRPARGRRRDARRGLVRDARRRRVAALPRLPESEARQRLLESGMAPEAAARAARYGRT